MKTLTATEWTSNPTPFNGGVSADDYTAFLQQEKLERTLTNIARRAENLWKDGYTLEVSTVLSGVYYVTSPKGDEYNVLCDAIMGKHCDCPAFGKFGTCKHLLATEWRLAEDAEADAEWERMEELRNFFDTRHDDY